jgi:ankyrin repeat protein
MLEKYLAILHNQPTQNSELEEVLRLFETQLGDDEDRWAAFDLSPLHKIVTSIIEVADPATAIVVAPESLDQRDSADNTALLWAAKRGHAENMHTLLDHGAESRIGDKADRTPLHYVGRCGDPGLVSKLMERRANIESRSIFGSTALHFAAVQAGDDTSFVQALLEHGANIEELNDQRRTVLSEAAKYNRIKIAQFLLQQNANLNHISGELETPVMEAVVHNSHKCISLFLARGASYHGVNREGNTIVHLAALSGDRKTLGILAGHRMEGIDLGARNACGSTVDEIASARIKRLREHPQPREDPGGWMADIQRLNESIKLTVASTVENLDAVDSDLVSDDDFFDCES